MVIIQFENFIIFIFAKGKHFILIRIDSKRYKVFGVGMQVAMSMYQNYQHMLV